MAVVEWAENCSAPHELCTEKMAASARMHLKCAQRVLRRTWWPRRAHGVDSALAHIHAAHVLVLRMVSLEDLRGMLPDLLMLIEDALPPEDRRRLSVERIFKSSADGRLIASQQQTVIDAVREAYWVQEREIVRERSFSHLVWYWTSGLLCMAVAIAVVSFLNQKLLPMCFGPTPNALPLTEQIVVCPLGEAPFKQNRDASFEAAASSFDYAVIEAAGFVAAAVTAAAALRQLKGSPTPSNVPLALACLKLPAGAVTAVLGILLMRADFVPGLSSLDSSAQIVGWAVIFGAAQHLFTKAVDARGREVMEAVPSPQPATAAAAPPSRAPLYGRA
ncbi:hypothetical protein [Saccharopolyspora phatthalungensis]|uniref:Uncharacterized protein n=1 Tax=Saccharopolyspora phatthalungensis TaxID=664693 RepID=A0A840QIT3_9PSEU|nr:hypothetical protein [Saccharopolyspora phatthalungensis]MBB5158679.1 hypothetical protein [Saccharopolyspora phatthalungensis]